ncbi:hypothetical protein [Dactylosporangium sp. NPDC048998]|uniref:hypothetical protein n=1 Tax=Dactylosporangium sp. NPDC048998 TaxID=3363976 RepID=UPI003711B6F8
MRLVPDTTDALDVGFIRIVMTLRRPSGVTSGGAGGSRRLISHDAPRGSRKFHLRFQLMNLAAPLFVVYAMTMAATREMCRLTVCGPTRQTGVSVPAHVVGCDPLPVIHLGPRSEQIPLVDFDDLIEAATALDPRAGVVRPRLDAPARR